MSKPTPRPWRTQTVKFAKDVWLGLLNKDGMECAVHKSDIVAITFDTEDDDNPDQKDQFNAALIVKAVNMHDELVDALKVLAVNLTSQPQEEWHREIFELLEKAVAK
jgi:hypothetical protein